MHFGTPRKSAEVYSTRTKAHESLLHDPEFASLAIIHFWKQIQGNKVKNKSMHLIDKAVWWQSLPNPSWEPAFVFLPGSSKEHMIYLQHKINTKEKG